MTDPICPKCACEHAYPDGSGLWICPECAHEWNPEHAASAEDENVIKDSVGNVLADGGNGHDIACKIPGIGNMDLKSEFVRKA